MITIFVITGWSLIGFVGWLMIYKAVKDDDPSINTIWALVICTAFGIATLITGIISMLVNSKIFTNKFWNRKVF